MSRSCMGPSIWDEGAMRLFAVLTVVRGVAPCMQDYRIASEA